MMFCETLLGYFRFNRSRRYSGDNVCVCTFSMYINCIMALVGTDAYRSTMKCSKRKHIHPSLTSSFERSNSSGRRIGNDPR